MPVPVGSIAVSQGGGALELSPTFEKWSGAPLKPGVRDRKIMHNKQKYEYKAIRQKTNKNYQALTHEPAALGGGMSEGVGVR